MIKIHHQSLMMDLKGVQVVAVVQVDKDDYRSCLGYHRRIGHENLIHHDYQTSLECLKDRLIHLQKYRECHFIAIFLA